MKSTDWIRNRDAEFNEQQKQLIAYANSHLAALGLVAADLTQVLAYQTTWNNAFTQHQLSHNQAKADKIAKDEARKALAASIRALARKLRVSASVNDSELAALGIRIADRQLTPLSAPTTAPQVDLDISQRLKIDIRFWDPTGDSKGKPKGVIGANVFVKVGGARPGGLEDCRYVGLATRSPFTVSFEGEQGRAAVYFILQWVNRKGETGPISQTHEGTVVA